MKQAIYDLAIIGGGAAGLMAAAAASEKGIPKILILESQKKLGKRLAATGGGRCNLSNREMFPSHYHGESEKIGSILERFPPKAIEKTFLKLGLLCREEEGRIYPYTLQASSVVSVLLQKAEEAGAALLPEHPVSAVSIRQGMFLLRCGENGDKEFFAKYLIFASGGLSYPSLGGSSSGWDILRSLGYTVIPGFPSLVMLTTPKKLVFPLKGIRSRGKVTLYLEGRPVKESKGEIQFTEQGLSGICVFELSRAYGEYAEKGGKKAELSCDFLPEYTEEALFDFLLNRYNASKTFSSSLLEGMVSQKLAKAVMNRVLSGKGGWIPGECRGTLASAARFLKDFRFPVTGSAGWNSAQVTAGGVSLKEVNLRTMESLRHPGLFFAGELLNIDGDCGGYNLHWAWSTGCLAGMSAAAAWRKENGGL